MSTPKSKRRSTATRRPWSQKVETFKDLALGQEFVFPAHPEAFMYHESQTYIKVSARCYVGELRTGPYKIEVGSTGVDVVGKERKGSAGVTAALKACAEQRKNDKAEARRLFPRR